MPSIPKEKLAEVEPFFALAEKLGKFLIQVSEGTVKELNISYAGEVANYDVRPLTANAIKGLLSTNHGTHVNDVNARYLAERVGIKINEHKTTTAKGFTNLVTVEIVTDKETHSVAGTLLNGLGAPKDNREQLENYKELLQQIGYTNVKAFLWYILDDIIIPI